MSPFPRPAAAAAGAVLLLLALTSSVHTQWTAGPYGQQELNLLSRDLFAGNGTTRSRTGRIFQFTKDDVAIRVELSFAIPFLSIPVGSKASGSGALVDVNLGALAAGGVFTAAAMLFIPHLFEGLSPQIALGRAAETGSGWSAALRRVDQLLKEQRVDAGACAQRALCSVAEAALTNVRAGAAGSADKILDGVLSNEWLSNVMKDTFIEDAINSARYGGNCTTLYSACPLSQKKLKNVATNLVKIIKS